MVREKDREKIFWDLRDNLKGNKWEWQRENEKVVLGR